MSTATIPVQLYGGILDGHLAAVPMGCQVKLFTVNITHPAAKDRTETHAYKLTHLPDHSETRFIMTHHAKVSDSSILAEK